MFIFSNWSRHAPLVEWVSDCGPSLAGNAPERMGTCWHLCQGELGVFRRQGSGSWVDNTSCSEHVGSRHPVGYTRILDYHQFICQTVWGFLVGVPQMVAPCSETCYPRNILLFPRVWKACIVGSEISWRPLCGGVVQHDHMWRDARHKIRFFLDGNLKHPCKSQTQWACNHHSLQSCQQMGAGQKKHIYLLLQVVVVQSTIWTLLSFGQKIWSK